MKHKARTSQEPKPRVTTTQPETPPAYVEYQDECEHLRLTRRGREVEVRIYTFPVRFTDTTASTVLISESDFDELIAQYDALAES